MEGLLSSRSNAVLMGLACLGLAIIPATSVCRAQMTANVLSRVLDLRVNPNTIHDETATGFTIGVDGREYLITAKHVVAGLGDQATIEVNQNDHWADLPVKIFR